MAFALIVLTKIAWGGGLTGDTSPPSLPQVGFLPSELALSSPGPLSPSGIKGGSQYYSYSGHPRRRATDSSLGEWARVTVPLRPSGRVL